MPLFHAAWLFSLGIAASQRLTFRPSFVLLALGPVAAITVLAAFRAQRILWLPLAVLWLLLGDWSALMEPHPSPGPELALLSDGMLRTVEGTVVDTGPVRSEPEQNLDEPLMTSPAERIDIDVSSVEFVNNDVDEQLPVTGGVRLTVRWQAASAQETESALPALACGDRIRTVARLLPPEAFRDPGAFSRTDYLLDQGITSTGGVTRDRIEVLASTRAPLLLCRLSALQHLAAARLLAVPAEMGSFPAPLRLTEEDAILLASMMTGDRTFLNRSLRAGFERTGSFHMLVVSGFHLAIVAACIFWLTRRLRLSRVPATLATIAASFLYAVFAGFATPVQRSLWMITLYLLGRLVYRQRSPMNAIGFAALCLLAAEPRSLLDSSFQMTLLAVISIAGVAIPLLSHSIHPFLAATRDLELVAIDASLPPRIAQLRVQLRMISHALHQAADAAFRLSIAARTVSRVPALITRFALRFSELVLVSLVVELVMTLPMAVYFHRITLFSLPVNLFTLPLLVVLMPAALLTLAISILSPAAAAVPAAITAIPLHFSRWLVLVFGGLALGDIRIPAPPLIQSLVAIALLGAAIPLARSTRRSARRAAWIALFLAALAAIAPRPVDHPHDGLLVEVLDVGQGDAILVITPDAKTLLIDAGGFGGGPREAPQDFDIGEEVVSPALWARGIRHLDVVALSHAHSDHMGGMPAVLRNFHPDELWIGKNPPVAAYSRLLALADGLHTRIQALHAGDKVSLGLAEADVLAPLPDYQPGPEPANNDSLVLRITLGTTSVLLEGDAEAPIERAMLSEAQLASALLKVGHHGSITSTRPEFLAQVSPQFAVISCGLRNRYGHPRPEILAELQSAHIPTFSTDINGATCFLLRNRDTSSPFPCTLTHP